MPKGLVILRLMRFFKYALERRKAMIIFEFNLNPAMQWCFRKLYQMLKDFIRGLVKAQKEK
jgi:hypothetical protein